VIVVPSLAARKRGASLDLGPPTEILRALHDPISRHDVTRLVGPIRRPLLEETHVSSLAPVTRPTSTPDRSRVGRAPDRILCAVSGEPGDDAVAQLIVATCQFPVSPDVARNGRYVMHQLRTASERGAQVAHFPEACLSGYAGPDRSSYDDLDWTHLEGVTRQLFDLAGELRLWLIIGSAHRLTGSHKPHDSVYVVNDTGTLVDRYDKRFCSGDPSGQSGDLAHFTPGDHLTVFDVRGIRCGVLVCYDYRFPELYREYKRSGVQLMFHSFHAANVAPEVFHAMDTNFGTELLRLNGAGTYPGITMPPSMTAAAAANHMWISCPNSSAPESCWGSFFVRADGVTTGRLPRNRAGVLISSVDTRIPLYDSTFAWRDRALDGQLHSGTLVDDPRSDNRTQL